MKKLFFVMAGLLMISVMNAQTLDEIVKKYTAANKLDQVGNHKTIKITANISMMGMEMPMQIWMKNPDKVKSVTSFNGQEIVQVVDGSKGYSINPMAGSSDPVAMTPDQISQTARSNMFQNYMADYLKAGKLSLEGEENVNDKPAYKIKATVDEGTTSDIYIDKTSYLMVKQSIISNGMAIDSYATDYTETNGFMIPMKTTTSAQGMEILINFTKVEVDIPIEDSVFEVK